jgi:hypothetical protein
MFAVLLGLALSLGLSAGARADEVASVEVALESGEVVGRTLGLGTAEVTAKVTNRGERAVEGIRIAVYYSQIDTLPQPGADWRVHEFVFEPPLKPGGVSTLKFKDDGAAEYILIETRRVKFAAAVRYNGKLAPLQFPLLTQGSDVYIAVRDLADALGAQLSTPAGAIVLARGGRSVKVQGGSTAASVDGRSVTLTRGVLEVNGRAYLALEDAASLFGLTMTRDGALDLVELSDL